MKLGWGDTSPTWALIQPEIARITRVCAYDRAGMGWNDPSPLPRDAMHIAEEPHKLLNRAGVSGPYIFVGYSYGGLYSRAYIARYPSEVAGLVLLESAHPDQYTRTPEAQSGFQRAAWFYRVFPLLARLGVMRLTGWCRPPSGFPPLHAAEIQAWCSTVSNWETRRAEVEAIPVTMAQIREATIPRSLPVLVISAGWSMQTDPLWATLQRELADLSSDSRHIIVENATYNSLLDDLHHARAVIEAILEWMNALCIKGMLWQGNYLGVAAASCQDPLPSSLGSAGASLSQRIYEKR